MHYKQTLGDNDKGKLAFDKQPLGEPGSGRGIWLGVRGGRKGIRQHRVKRCW